MSFVEHMDCHHLVVAVPHTDWYSVAYIHLVVAVAVAVRIHSCMDYSHSFVYSFRHSYIDSMAVSALDYTFAAAVLAVAALDHIHSYFVDFDAVDVAEEHRIHYSVAYSFGQILAAFVVAAHCLVPMTQANYSFVAVDPLVEFPSMV